MALFEQNTFPVPFTCQYCGSSQWETNGAIPVCGCAQSQAAAVATREANKALAKQRQEQEPSFYEIRMMRKLRTRKCAG